MEGLLLGKHDERRDLIRITVIVVRKGVWQGVFVVMEAKPQERARPRGRRDGHGGEEVEKVKVCVRPEVRPGNRLTCQKRKGEISIHGRLMGNTSKEIRTPAWMENVKMRFTILVGGTCPDR